MRKSCFAGLGALAVALCGCGGGGGSQSSIAPVSVSIHWAGRSRALNSPASAQSVVITMLAAASDGSDLTFTVNRDLDPAEYTRTVSSGATARTGSWELEASFKSLPDGKGDTVGNAMAAVIVKSGAPLLSYDGSPMGSIVTTGAIAAVNVAPGQVVTTAKDVDLVWTALDAGGNVLALSPGSAFFTTISGSEHLQITRSGHAHGLSVGRVGVSVNVDGVFGGSEVFVTPDIALTSIALPVNDLAYDPISGRLFASVPSAAGSARGNSITVIDPATGALGASIHVGSEPTRMAITDDGQFLYVWLSAAGRLQRMNLAKMTVDLTIGPFTGSAPFVDLAVVPGDSHQVILAWEGGSSSSGVLESYRDAGLFWHFGSFGSTVPNAIGAACEDRVTLDVLDAQGGVTFFTLPTAAAGVPLHSGAFPLFNSDAQSIKAGNFGVIAADGIVARGQRRIGSFDLGTASAVRATGAFDIDSAAGRSYYLTAPYAGGFVTLRSYDLSAFTPVAELDLPLIAPQGTDTQISHLVHCGAGRFAYAVGAVGDAPPKVNLITNYRP